MNPSSAKADVWIYNDNDCLVFARPLVWNLDFEFATFEIGGFEDPSEFAHRIANQLSVTPDERQTVKIESKQAIFYSHQCDSGNWFFIAFVTSTDHLAQIKTSQWAVSINPVQIKLIDHFKSLVFLSLFEDSVDIE